MSFIMSSFLSSLLRTCQAGFDRRHSGAVNLSSRCRAGLRGARRRAWQVDLPMPISIAAMRAVVASVRLHPPARAGRFVFPQIDECTKGPVPPTPGVGMGGTASPVPLARVRGHDRPVPLAVRPRIESGSELSEVRIVVRASTNRLSGTATPPQHSQPSTGSARDPVRVRSDGVDTH